MQNCLTMGSLSIIRHTQMRGIRSGRLSNNPYKFLGCNHCRTSCDDPDTNTKKIFPIKPKYVPAIALAFGLFISIFISHKHNFLAGVFMGFFYGYAAIGNYASLKTTIKSIKNKKKYNNT